jgi:excisionase family DNA binding protein
MMSTTQVAELASTTRFTVEREIRRGNLHGQKIGRTWVIDQAEAERWAAQFTPYAGLRKDGEQGG